MGAAPSLSGGALEPLFGACPPDDLVTLAESDPGPLGSDHRPELVEARVQLP